MTETPTTIERFTVYKVVAGRAHWKGDPDGMWVLFEDAQRDLVALQAENEKLMEANLSVSVCASHTQEITDAGYMNGCVVCEVEAQVARADAAEARVTLLEDAIRKVKAHGVPMDMGCCFYCASSQPERRHHSSCEWAALVAFVVDPSPLQEDE